MAQIKKTLAMVAFQTVNPDGSITIRAKELADHREIGSKEAAEILGFRDRETISRLVEAGEIKGWKPATLRGNGKWRICLQSVLDYRDGQVNGPHSFQHRFE